MRQASSHSLKATRLAWAAKANLALGQLEEEVGKGLLKLLGQD